MAEDFKINVDVDADFSKIEGKLDALEKSRKIKLDIELDKSAEMKAKDIAKSIEKGLNSTKIDTGNIASQLASAFNLDKSVTSKLKTQMNGMMKFLASSFDGKSFDLSRATGFLSGADKLIEEVEKNAKILKSKTGIYDEFFDYFKNKKIYISDSLKSAMGADNYSELLKNNVGKIVRDATKGISIDSIWDEMVDTFPEHFSKSVINQVDQVTQAFDVLKRAREDVTQTIAMTDLKGADLTRMKDAIAESVVDAVHQMYDALQYNIQSTMDIEKASFEVDVEINKDKLASDIREAIHSAGSDGLKVDLNIDSESLLSEMRNAINQLSAGDEPMQMDIHINKESLCSDLSIALNDIDLPIHFNVDTAELEAQIRAAVDNITDINIDLHVNTEHIQDEAPRTPDLNGWQQFQQILHNTSRAGRSTQNVFSSMGDTFREAFSAFTMADLITDGIYKIADAGRKAIDTVKEFNDIETNLAMATGKSREYVKNLVKDYNELGREIGSVTSDVAKSADSWLRQGRSMSETNGLIKDSMILAKDTKLDTDQSSKILTATLNGFQLSAEQASHINDVLTSIDLESASDAGGIGTSLTKTASMAHNAGVSLEKTAAMIATVKDVTQQTDETIGTSIKSILSRMNNIKVGKFVDEETGEALNDTEKVLNKVGISMRDANDQFLDSETILDNVAGKWKTFDKNTQKAIATAMAGTRQVNSFVAMLDNWDKVQKLTETAMTSDGMAQKKFEENYLTSLEAKTNALKASMENLSVSFISDDFFAGFLDGSKAIVDFVANTELLQSALAGLGAAGGVFAIQQLVGAFRGLSDFSAALDLSKIANMSDDIFESLLNLSSGLSRSQTELLLSSNALTETQRVAILMNQGMSAAEAQSAVASMGLATAQGTAATATVSLSGALKGLWATLIANPLILVAAGVMAGVTAFNAYKRSVEEVVSSAKQAGNSWQESNSSIQSNIDKVKELREALASGTLSEQEAYSAKSELLSIQQSLTDSYGSQVAGIDLVNGSLTEQIGLLDQLSQKESEHFLNENKKGIEKATKEIEKQRYTYLGQFSDDGTEQAAAIKKSIEKLQNKYGKDVFNLTEGMEGTGSFKINFEADASSAKEALNDFMSEMDVIESKYGKSDLLESMSNNAYGGLKEANKILDEYGELYNQAQKAELFSDKETFKANGKQQTAAKWMKDYTDAVKQYNDALSEGDTSKITEAEQKFQAIDNAVNSLISNSGMAEYADQFEEVRSQLNEMAISAHTFNEALSGNDSSKFGKTVQKNRKELEKLKLTDTDFTYAFETDGFQEGEEAVNGLVDAALECGLISDTSSEQVQKLVSVLVNLGVISSGTGSAINVVTESVSNLSEEIKTVQGVIAGINESTSLLTSQSTGKSISIDSFNSENLKDYQSALEYVNGSMQLNTEKVRELQKAKAEEAIATNDATKAQQQSKYMENIREIENLQDKLRELDDIRGQNAQAIHNSIDALVSENDSIVNQCSQLDILSASLREATGAYQNWLDKRNGSEKGDMFDDAMGALQHIEDTTQNTDSEYYGRIGRESYKAAVEFLVPDSISSENAEAVSSYIDSIEHYFNHDENGGRTGLDVTEFCEKSVQAGLMVFDEASDKYRVAGQRTMEDFAEGLNLSLPMVQAMFGEMEEFGAEWSWTDEAVQTLGDMAMAAGEAKGRIEELADDLDIQIDVSNIENVDDKVSTLENTISQMQNYKGTVGIDASQVEDANAIIQYCVTQKQMLEAPAVMSVDSSQVQGEVGNAISLLQQFKEAQNNVEMQAAIGADTSEAQGKVDSLVAEIKGLSPEIKAKLGIDGASEAAITASITALTPEVMVKAGVDETLVNAWASTEKKSSGKVKWNNDTSSVDAWASQVHTSKGTVTWGNDIAAVKTHFSATGTVNWTNTTPPSGGKGKANGTANVLGTAHYTHLVGYANANGNWGTKTGGMTLLGELGREIVVDPRTGRWYTVGDNGAEFAYIPKNAIVFNHLQSEPLLERGFVNSRGTALASGTAMVTGGISRPQANIASGNGSYKPTTQNTTAQNQNTQATNANTSAKKENTKAAKEATETFDWVKNKIQVFSKAVETFAKRITEYASYPLKKLNLNRQMGAIEKEINANRKGYETYMNKANSIGISDQYKKLVQSGEFRIEDIDTSTDVGKKLAENIKKYQNYYNAALDCSDAITELNNKHIELFDTLVNLPIEETEKKVEKLEKRLNSLSSFMSTISSGGSAIHALQKIVKADNPNINKVNSNLSKAKEREKSAHRVRSSASKAYSASRKEQEESKDALTSALSKKTNSAGKLLKKAAKGSTSKTVYRAITNAIKSGNPVNLKGLKGDDLKAAKKYNETLKQQKYVDSKVKAGKGVSTKRVSKDLLDLAKEYNTDTKNMNSAQEAYEKSVDAHNKAKKDVSNAQAKKDSVDRATTAEQRALANLDTSKQSYLVQNDWLDEEIKILKDKNKAYKDAVNKTTSTADKQLKKQNDRQKSLLKNKKFIKSLNKEQLADLKKGEQIDLEGLTGENLKIAEQWNKAVQKTTVALDAQSDALHNLTESEAELAQKLVENEKQKLENISNFYDAFIAQFEAKNSVINSAMGELEAKGYAMSKSFYEAQIAQNQATIKSLEEQRKAMMESFQKALDNDTIQEGTIEYYEMQASIDKVTASLQNAKTEIAQLEKNIRELEWKQFDRLQESIKRIASESDFLIELMSSKELYDKDTGKLTNEGLATMGLHGVNYNTYMQQADKYREEMLKINEQLAKDPHNQELEDRRNELLDLQQQSILAAEKEKLAIKDMVENGIELELDAIDELIDKYLEAIESKRELYEYEKKIQKQTEEIASLQKQMSVYMNDNSEEARKKVQQIKENLKEAQENLKETEYDKFIDDQKELLESLRNEYEEVLNKRLDNIDVLIQTTIDEINTNSGVIKDTLIEQADKVGYTLTPELQNIWTSTDGVKDVLSAYDGNFTNTMTTLQGTVQGIVDKQQETIKALEEQARQVIAAINSSMTPPTANPDKSESDDGDKGSSDDKKDPPKYDPSIENAELETEKPNKKPSTSKTKTVKVGDVLTYKSGVYYGASDGTGLTGNLYRGKKVKIDRINKESWAKYPYSISSADGKTELGWVGLNQLELKGYKLKGYATGGNVLKNQWANVNERGQELVEYKGATLLPLPGGAEVWNASKTNNVLSDILDPMKAFNKNYGMISGMTNKNDGIGNGTHIDNLSVSLPNVKDGEDFVDYLVNSKKFEKLINTMTVDKMTGRANKLTKYQYRK